MASQSETSFTPGPWVTFEFGSQGLGMDDEIGLGVCAEGTSAQIMMGDESGLICFCHPDLRANASLIAAAPSMHGAIESALNYIENGDHGKAHAVLTDALGSVSA